MDSIWGCINTSRSSFSDLWCIGSNGVIVDSTCNLRVERFFIRKKKNFVEAFWSIGLFNFEDTLIFIRRWKNERSLFLRPFPLPLFCSYSLREKTGSYSAHDLENQEGILLSSLFNYPTLPVGGWFIFQACGLLNSISSNEETKVVVRCDVRLGLNLTNTRKRILHTH